MPKSNRNLNAIVEDALDAIRIVPRVLSTIQDGYLEKFDSKALGEIVVVLFPHLIRELEREVGLLENALHETKTAQ